MNGVKIDIPTVCLVDKGSLKEPNAKEQKINDAKAFRAIKIALERKQKELNNG